MTWKIIMNNLQTQMENLCVNPPKLNDGVVTSGKCFAYEMKVVSFAELQQLRKLNLDLEI